ALAQGPFAEYADAWRDVYVSPSEADEILKVFADLNRTGDPTVNLGMLVAFNEAAQTGDFGPFFERYPDANIPLSALSAFVNSPETWNRIVAAAQNQRIENAPIGEGMANFFRQTLGLELPSTWTPAQLKSVFGSALGQSLLEFAMAPNE